MAKSKIQTIKPPRKPPRLESLEKLWILLESLNEQPDRYVPYDEIEKEFMKRLNHKKKFDEVDLRNKLVNVLSYAEGLRDDLPPANEKGLPDQYVPHTTSFFADIAQIRQTKLIDRMRLPLKEDGKTREQDCYMITIRGIEVLNHLRNSRHSEGLLASSKRLEILTLALLVFTGYLIVYSITSIMISCKGETSCYSYPLEVGFGTVVTIIILIAIVLFLYSKLKSKRNAS
jgi:hypothetical protein